MGVTMEYKLKDGRVLLVREANENDAKEILEHMELVVSESDFLLSEPDEIDWDIEREKKIIKMYRESKNDLFLVAEFDGKVVGMLNFRGGKRRRVKHKGEFGISVRKKYWGLGIGSALLNTLILWAKKVGIKKIQLEVVDGNERAINLYLKYGFEIEGRKKRAVFKDGIYIDLIIMGRWLG